MVAGGSAEIRYIFVPGTFYENIKSAWESAEAKDTFLTAIFYETTQCTCIVTFWSNEMKCCNLRVLPGITCLLAGT